MRRLLLVAAFWLLSFSTLSAQQLRIDPKYHVGNIGSGYCGHCCLETIARHFGIKTAVGRTDRMFARFGKDGGGLRDDELKAIIHELGMTYSEWNRGTYDYKRLNWACQNNFPTVVSFRPPPNRNSGHYVVLVGFYTDFVALIDSNLAGHVTWMTRNEFARQWTGGMIVIYPP